MRKIMIGLLLLTLYCNPGDFCKWAFEIGESLGKKYRQSRIERKIEKKEPKILFYSTKEICDYYLQRKFKPYVDEELVKNGWNLVWEVKGDFNKDGKEDFIRLWKKDSVYCIGAVSNANPIDSKAYLVDTILVDSYASSLRMRKMDFDERLKAIEEGIRELKKDPMFYDEGYIKDFKEEYNIIKRMKNKKAHYCCSVIFLTEAWVEIYYLPKEKKFESFVFFTP